MNKVNLILVYLLNVLFLENNSNVTITVQMGSLPKLRHMCQSNTSIRLLRRGPI